MDREISGWIHRVIMASLANGRRVVTSMNSFGGQSMEYGVNLQVSMRDLSLEQKADVCSRFREHTHVGAVECRVDARGSGSFSKAKVTIHWYAGATIPGALPSVTWDEIRDEGD